MSYMSSQKHQVFIKSQSWDTLVLVVIVVVVFDRDLVDIVIIDIVIVVDVFDVLDILVKNWSLSSLRDELRSV